MLNDHNGEDPTPIVVGLGGSTRTGSKSLEALRVCLGAAADAGAETHLLDIRELALPILDAGQPAWQHESVRTLLGQVRRASGLIVASPVYQETVSGAIKNALDYLYILEQEEPFGLTGTVVATISVSGSISSMGASLAVQTACRGLKGWVLPEPVDLAGNAFGKDGRLYDVLARDRLRLLGRTVVRSAIARRTESQAGEPVEAHAHHSHHS